MSAGGYSQSSHIPLKRSDVGFGHSFPGKIFLLSPADDFVINVGKISNPGNLQPLKAKVTHHDVKNHRRAGMTDVAVIIDSDPAGVNLDDSGFEGDKRFFPFTQGIINLQ